VIRRYPFASFYLLCLGITWPLATLFDVSLTLPLIGLFGPALAALIVSRVTHGREGVRVLLARLGVWRVHPFWYVFAIGLPALLAILAWGLNSLVGTALELRIARVSPLGLGLAILVVGEELGWRGFALPLLLTRLSASQASLLIGVLWGFWHLPNFYLPGYPQQGLPLVAFILSTTAYSVVFSFLFLHTRGSVLLATVLHASINLFAPVGIDPVRQYWLEALVWGGVALCLWLFLGPDLARGGARASTMRERRGKAVS
jgi:membrane protease YdiL (CAAX protease family)